MGHTTAWLTKANEKLLKKFCRFKKENPNAAINRALDFFFETMGVEAWKPKAKSSAKPKK